MLWLAKIYACLDVFSCVALVSAGSWVWEPAHRPADFTKRWVTVEPLKGMDMRWPGGTVKYCWADRESESKLSADLTAARDLWYRMGLDERMFKWEKQSALTCSTGANRKNWLKIKYNDKGVLSTTNGRQPINEKKDPKYKGPTMHLSDSLKVGFLERVPNYAHEIGHAWGLLHEHQDLIFWEHPFGPKLGKLWGAQLTGIGIKGELSTWHCDNLADYDEHWSKYKQDHSDPNDDGICVFRSTASKYKFMGAIEYLPYWSSFRSPFTVGQARAGAGESDVDWDSIMLYPSGAGGKGDVPIPAEGQPPLDLVTQDPRKPILTKANGQRYGSPKIPSNADVGALFDLYGLDSDTLPEYLFNQKQSKWHDPFTKMIKSSRCA